MRRVTTSPFGERKAISSPIAMLPRVTRPVATVPRPVIEKTSSTSNAKGAEELAEDFDDASAFAARPGSFAAGRLPKIMPTSDAKSPFGISAPHRGQVGRPCSTSLWQLPHAVMMGKEHTRPAGNRL